ncbi:MAG: N-acetylmuramoyl-L-alanine amidase [candidate division KSB1 bacterium]|nr:N-acetylmuramoyl-L-alanine amidase [candidate division KSB1 bacterium]MDZ7304282.1 N-acetylmuramoyl-L-alanine amidase [candidate division KSB1 bacterium]MDZ7312919.1 N-acetylmuramoyl-L-alanine amidase [candidate division KSB1 bacterium]
MKRVFSATLRLLFALACLSAVVGLWACGAKPLPRYHKPDRDRETRRPLYPLISNSMPRKTPAPKAELVPQASVPPSHSSSGWRVSRARTAASADRQTLSPPVSSELVFQTNARGEREAVYRLKKGEALYSAVVVRFTGRVDADEVNRIAQRLLEYNGISDATRIADGTAIRIPVRFLDDSILRGNFSPAPVPRPARPSRSGLHVILDAGHGGNDPGTTVRGWVEDEIAYDLMLRIKRGLQARGVKVYSTVRDRETGDALSSGALVNNREEYVKVTPEYRMDDSRVAVNLRIYLIEDLYQWLLRRGVDPENILLLSIHLDHLHPSVGGTMVYFPGADERVSEFRATGGIYRHFRESRIGTIRFRGRENENAEAASYAFARDLVSEFRQAGVPVHDYLPIRRYVYRHDQKWAPGIIRYSHVPISILLEAANLSNRNDFARIRSAHFRQRLAEAVVRAIMAQE